MINAKNFAQGLVGVVITMTSLNVHAVGLCSWLRGKQQTASSPSLKSPSASAHSTVLYDNNRRRIDMGDTLRLSTASVLKTTAIKVEGGETQRFSCLLTSGHKLTTVDFSPECGLLVNVASTKNTDFYVSGSDRKKFPDLKACPSGVSLLLHARIFGGAEYRTERYDTERGHFAIDRKYNQDDLDRQSAEARAQSDERRRSENAARLQVEDAFVLKNSGRQ